MAIRPYTSYQKDHYCHDGKVLYIVLKADRVFTLPVICSANGSSLEYTVYARRWAKKEDVELDTLSEWIKSIGDVLKRRIRRLKHSVNTRHESIFSDPDVVTELSRLHENFVIVPADKASINYTFVCKRYYVDILIEELGLHLLPGNPTYNLTDFSASEVLDNHKSVLTSFGIQTTDEELDLPYIYWIPKMHKNPYKHRFIAGSSK